MLWSASPAAPSLYDAHMSSWGCHGEGSEGYNPFEHPAVLAEVRFTLLSRTASFFDCFIHTGLLYNSCRAAQSVAQWAHSIHAGRPASVGKPRRFRGMPFSAPLCADPHTHIAKHVRHTLIHGMSLSSSTFLSRASPAAYGFCSSRPVPPHGSVFLLEHLSTTQSETFGNHSWTLGVCKAQ